MEIYFCDICNESVPQADLEKGKAVRRGERVMCVACDHSMSKVEAFEKEGTPGQEKDKNSSRSDRHRSVGAAPGSGSGGVLLGLLAISIAAGGTAWLKNRQDRSGQDQAEAMLSLRGDLLNLERQGRDRTRRFEARLSESGDATRQSIESGQGETRKSLSELGQRVQELALQGERAAGDTSALRADLATAQKSQGEDLTQLEQRLVSLEQGMEFYQQRLIEIEGTLSSLAERGPLQPMGPIPVQPGADGAPAWQGLLADLSHSNPGIRIEAVYSLGQTADARVVPHLVPLLEDEDVFVRLGTTKVLMDLDARETIPQLIEVLADASPPVRESAMVALRKLSGKSFGYDPLGSESDRTRKQKAWRDWWEKDGASLLQG